jgi:hypothetical protein
MLGNRTGQAPHACILPTSQVVRESNRSRKRAIEMRQFDPPQSLETICLTTADLRNPRSAAVTVPGKEGSLHSESRGTAIDRAWQMPPERNPSVDASTVLRVLRMTVPTHPTPFAGWVAKDPIAKDLDPGTLPTSSSATTSSLRLGHHERYVQTLHRGRSRKRSPLSANPCTCARSTAFLAPANAPQKSERTHAGATVLRHWPKDRASSSHTQAKHGLR